MIQSDYPLYFVSYFIENGALSSTPKFIEVKQKEIRVFESSRSGNTVTAKGSEAPKVFKRYIGEDMQKFYSSLDLDGNLSTIETALLARTVSQPPQLRFNWRGPVNNKIAVGETKFMDVNADGVPDKVTAENTDDPQIAYYTAYLTPLKSVQLKESRSRDTTS